MKLSHLLDTTMIEPGSINPDYPICSGYLDSALSIFEIHNHPFVLVSTHAMRWSGANNLPQKEIDVLVRSSQLKAIVDDLVASGDWKMSNNWTENCTYAFMMNNTSIKDIWLETCIDDPMFPYLRIWPEELYKLSVDCHKIEVPDVWARERVLLEEEYYRDPYERFGPPRLSTRERTPIPNLQFRAKIRRLDVPIFIPTIEEHLNAYLDQQREQTKSGNRNGGSPVGQIENFIRYLYLEWTPTQEWLLNSKIHERNQPLMTELLSRTKRKQLILYDGVLKKSVFDKMPWELTISSEYHSQKLEPERTYDVNGSDKIRSRI